MSKATEYNNAATDVRDFPTPGYNYRNRHEERGLVGIAERAYANGKEWRRIWSANKSHARTSDPNRGFWVGDILFIPGDPFDEVVEDVREDLSEEWAGDDANRFRLIINGTPVDDLVSARIMRTIDYAIDGWTAVVPFDATNAARRELYRPYSYHECAVYLGGRLVHRGRLYNVTPKVDAAQGRQVTLEGWSFGADAVDSTTSPPFEQNNVGLERRARDLLDPLGIDVVWEAGEDKPFKRCTAEKTDTVFEHLHGLAKQRGVLISSTAQGRMWFLKPTTSAPVATLHEGEYPFREMGATFDGRARFANYKCISTSPKKNKSATAVDPAIPSGRIRTFSADEGNDEDIQKAADWERSRAFGEALSIPFPVPSWYAPDGQLWQPNTLVTVHSDTLMVPNGVEFLIRSVENLYEREGASAVLNLVPPQIYTGEPIADLWARSE